MNEIISNASVLWGILIAVAFIVSAIVQLTKNYIPLPTKAWVILVSMLVVTCTMAIAGDMGVIKVTVSIVILGFFGSLLVAYIAMYGFDTLKELWNRLKSGGGGIDEK